MDFLCFDDGVIKNPFYRKEDADGEHSGRARRKWRRQRYDTVHSTTPVYTRNLLSKDKIPFQCEPAAVCFTDYDVGVEHQILVTFTNTARVPRTFRVMPISPRYANVVSVEYTVPPKISPGLLWDVIVKYRPRDLDDICTSLYVKTDIGYFAVPLTSSKKAFVFSLEPKKVNFGTVTVGEKRAKKITLRNDGAMPGTVIVGGDFKSLLDQRHTNPVDGKKTSFLRISPQQFKIEIPSFSTLQIVLKFAPLNPILIDSEITFTEKSDSQLAHAIPITGSSTDLPVFIRSGKLDFGACFYGERYWDEVSLVNNANVAAVAEFQLPTSLFGALDIAPSRVCIQAGEEYSVRVVFTPCIDLPKDFVAAIECAVQDQTLPLTLHLEAMLSHRAPRLPLSAFDIGVIPLKRMRSVQVPVTNESSVLQLVGFDDLPPWVTATPEVLALVPDEKASFTLKMEAPQEGRFSQRIKLMNEFGDTHYISLSGEGTRPPIALSARTLLLPPCNIGRSVSATTVLSNTSGESAVVAIVFHAPMETEHEEPLQLTASLQRPSKPKKDLFVGLVSEAPPQKLSMYNEWESGGENGLWIKHKQFRIQCRVNGEDDECDSIAVRCCAVRPSVRIEEVEKVSITPPVKQQKPTENDARQNLAKASVFVERDENGAASLSFKGEMLVDFGSVPIHHNSICSCKVINTGDKSCMIRAPPLNPFSSFSVLTVAFGDVSPHTEVEIPVSFHPRTYGKFSEVIKVEMIALDGVVTFVFVHVQGSCSPTQLIITSAETVSQLDAAFIVSVQYMTFDCTRKKESTRKAVHFHNVGSFPLDIHIYVCTEGDEGVQTGNVATDSDPRDILPFLVHPRTFTLQPNTKQTVDVVFAPSDSGIYSKRLSISASGERSELVLEGRSVSGGIYSLVPISDARTGKPIAVSFEGDIGCRPDYPISLPFEEEEVKTLIIGNLLKGLSVGYEVQNWEQTRPLEMLPEWNVAPVSQTIEGGKEAQLSVRRFFLDDGEGVEYSFSSSFPFRFAIVLRGEGPWMPSYRVLYVVCTD